MTARSYLYVPGDQPAKLAKAAGSEADAVIADLEDGVAPAGRAAARREIRSWLDDLDGPHPDIWVRVNAEQSALADDLAVAAVAPTVGVVVPKAEPGMLTGVAERLRAAEEAAGREPGSLRLFALVETPQGLLAAPEIAAMDRVAVLGAGEADLGARLGLPAEGADAEWLPIRLQLVVASAAAGIAPPAGPVSLDFRDLESLGVSTRALRRAGFGGRTAIHPAQLPVINAAFTPTADEVASAGDVVRRFEAAVAAGTGVTVDAGGRMIDAPVVAAARRVLARAERYGAGPPDRGARDSPTPG